MMKVPVLEIDGILKNLLQMRLMLEDYFSIEIGMDFIIKDNFQLLKILKKNFDNCNFWKIVYYL